MTEFLYNQLKPRRPAAAAAAWTGAVAALLFFTPGCGDGGRGGGSGAECAECARRAASTTQAVPASQNAEPLTPGAFALLMGRAAEAVYLDEPVAVMPPLLSTGVAETNDVDAIRLQMRDNAKSLNHYILLRHEYETKLQKEDSDVRALWKNLQAVQADYDSLLAEKMSNSMVPDRIFQHTRLQQTLSEQLRKLQLLNPEETP